MKDSNKLNKVFGILEPLPKRKLSVKEDRDLRPMRNKGVRSNLLDQEQLNAESGSARRKPKLGQKYKNDERYERFFKMMSVGVPRAAVEAKMRQEDIDPSILDE